MFSKATLRGWSVPLLVWLALAASTAAFGVAAKWRIRRSARPLRGEAMAALALILAALSFLLPHVLALLIGVSQQYMYPPQTVR
ncbi:MAG: hypothetical protein ACHRHE_16855 [Tepidisphaerales bacterium]